MSSLVDTVNLPAVAVAEMQCVLEGKRESLTKLLIFYEKDCQI